MGYYATTCQCGHPAIFFSGGMYIECSRCRARIAFLELLATAPTTDGPAKPEIPGAPETMVEALRQHIAVCERHPLKAQSPT